MPKKPQRPTYCHHRPSGNAYCRLVGKVVYLGRWDSPESRQRFADLVHEWATRHDSAHLTLTIDDLALGFLDFADGHYRHPDGTPTGAVKALRDSLGYLVRAHGTSRVRDFGPLKLKQVRQAMIEADLGRTHINRSINNIRRVFAWGVENELVPVAIHQALKAVAPLRAGRSAARESEPVAPVPIGTVEATLPHLPATVAALVRLQLLTGARPGEICLLRPGDVTIGTDGVWTYRPLRHKTEHRGKDRRIFIGPEGQAVLRPFLDRDPESFCFRPCDSEQERNARRRTERRSPMTPSQAARRPQSDRQRAPTERYTKDTYGRAVTRGCEIAFGMPAELRYVGRCVARLPAAEQAAARERLAAAAKTWRAAHCWSPNQLRHTRATMLRERYGIEAARLVLGHADAGTTLIYAERDHAATARIQQEIG